jgi:glycosyltransferase involved in cell wall biosynthesis
VLIELKDDPEQSQRIGKRGQEIASKFFDKDYLADKMLQILKAV